MSINLGIYDFFSYLIPGVFYLYAVNELLRSIGWKSIDVASLLQTGQVPNILGVILILFFAFIVGHILDSFANRFLYSFIRRIRRHPPAYVLALQIEKKRYPDLNIEFEPMDWPVLLALLRQRNIDMARITDKYQADSIMLRNIALGSTFLVFIHIGDFFFLNEKASLINSFGAIVLFLFTYWRSTQYRSWFYLSLFEASLEYGSSLKEVVEYNREKKSVKEIESIKRRRTKDSAQDDSSPKKSS